MNPLLLKRPRRKQPLNITPVDRNHPITEGMMAVFVGTMAYDPVTGRPFINSAPGNRSMGKAGLGVDGRVGQAKLALGGPSISTGSMFAVFDTTDATTEQIIAEVGPDGAFTAGVRGIRFIAGQFSTYVRNFYDLIGTGVYRVNAPIAVGAAYAGAKASLYVNGRLDGAGTTADTNATADVFNLGGITGQTSYNVKGTIPIGAVWNRELSAGEMAWLAENYWSVFPSEMAMMSRSAPVNTGLTGAAVAVASAYGALSTGIPLSGAGVLQSATTATLATSIPLAGAAVVRSRMTGALAGSPLTLSGAAITAVAAAGTLSTSIPLAGVAGAGVVVAGALSASVRLTGVAAARATAAGSLAGSAVQLSGRVDVVATATGNLSTSIALAGIVTSTATATAALSAGRPGGQIDISKIHPSRIVIFGGSGSRVTPFDGSGSRVTRFE
jgi:hypothetical protein